MKRTRYGDTVEILSIHEKTAWNVWRTHFTGCHACLRAQIGKRPMGCDRGRPLRVAWQYDSARYLAALNRTYRESDYKRRLP